MAKYKVKLTGEKFIYGEQTVDADTFEEAVYLAKNDFKKDNDCDCIYVTDIREVE